MLDDDKKVAKLFCQQQYPCVDDLAGGEVMRGCWLKQYTSAEDIVEAIDREMMGNNVGSEASCP